MEDKNYEIIKFIDGELELEVNVSAKEETIWLSLDQMAKLFKRNKSVISRHIKNIFEQSELLQNSVVAKNAITAKDGKVYSINYYNLDMILAVGYRVNSVIGINFRKWVNKVLKEYLLKGYVINENRVTVSNENYIELKNQVTNVNNRLITIEDKVLEKVYKIDKIFYNKEFYYSYSLIQSIFESSNNR